MVVHFTNVCKIPSVLVSMYARSGIGEALNENLS